MQKTLALVVLVLASWAAHAEPTPTERLKAETRFMERFKAELRAHSAEHNVDPKGWVVKDTGQKIDNGEGPGPVYEVYHNSKPHTCLVAVHPKDPTQMAVLGCHPREVVRKLRTL